MKFDLAIEVGTTFTDGFFRDDAGRMEGVKVETIPHGLMECFVDCINEGAKRWSVLSLTDFIGNLNVVKLSIPAICHGTLIGRAGPRIGLIVTDGFEENVYCEKSERNPILDLIESKMVVAVREEVNSNGEKLLEPDVGQVRELVRYLLESGAASIVISLKNASLNPINEKTIREMIESDYPKHFLGAVPISISTELSYEADDFSRTNICLLNVYCWQNVADFLGEVEAFLGNHKFNGTLLVAHDDGGVAKIDGITPIKTFASDHTTLAFAIRKRNENLGLPCILNLRTERDRTIATLIREVHANEYEDFDIAGIRVKYPQVNPYIDLNIGSTLRAGIDRDCIKLISTEDSAAEAIKEFETRITDCILEFLKREKIDRKKVVLFPSGLNAGLHCCEIADRLNISEVLYTPFSAFIGAFGCAYLGIAHSYEIFSGCTIDADAELQAVVWFNEKVNELRTAAYRDMKEEGVGSDEVTFSLTIHAKVGGEDVRVRSPKLLLENKEDIRSLFETLQNKISGNGRIGKMRVNSLLLHASERPRHEMQSRTDREAGLEQALIGKRKICLRNDYRDASLFEYARLSEGDTIKGLAVLESTNDVLIIPEGRKFVLGKYGDGFISNI
jgi:N-methylhydantoinase A/oxoprolinase/acetone carboxylase beta subunit